MPGTAGRSGAHNRLKHQGEALTASVRVEPWPWEDADDPDEGGVWAREGIFDYLARTLESWGVTRDKSAGDIVRHLADNHWLRMKAIAAEKNDKPTIGNQCVYGVIQRTSSAILTAYRELGVYPFGSVKVVPDGEQEEFDF